MREMKKIIVLLTVVVSVYFSGCTDASVASANLSKAADQFEIYRRVVFLNGITDTYILSVEGFCSIRDMNGQLEVTVKLRNGTYLKHFLGLSDNVTYFAEQLDPKKVSSKRYTVIFKPSVIIPNVKVR